LCMIMSVLKYEDLPLHKVNSDLVYLQENMPLPESKKGMPYKFKTYQDVDEPLFDPTLHLDLEDPEYVVTLPDFKPVDKVKEAGSLAYSKAFQFLSKEGLEVFRKIVEREAPEVAPSRGSRIALRGLHYSSPWVRDLCRHPHVLDHVSRIVGEKVVSSHDLPAHPQVNLSIPGAEGSAEFWHWDSITYVGNFLISDMEEMKGGELEVIKMEKREGMKALVNGTLSLDQLQRVNYEAPGRCVLAQGSEILHHVTPVRSDTQRVVVVLAFCAANVFQSDKMVLQTYIQEDRPSGNRSGLYEFFRGKAWVCGNALVGMSKVIPYNEDGKMMANRLRSVADELQRCADLVEEKTNDTIGFFDESKKQFEDDWLKGI